MLFKVSDSQLSVTWQHTTPAPLFAAVQGNLLQGGVVLGDRVDLTRVGTLDWVAFGSGREFDRKRDSPNLVRNGGTRKHTRAHTRTHTNYTC